MRQKLWPYVRWFLQGHIKTLNICFHLNSLISNKFMGQCECCNKNGLYWGFLTTTYSFEIWYRDAREGFWGILKAIFSLIDLDFFQIFFNIFFLIFAQAILLFHDIFLTNDPIFVISQQSWKMFMHSVCLSVRLSPLLLS